MITRTNKYYHVMIYREMYIYILLANIYACILYCTVLFLQYTTTYSILRARHNTVIKAIQLSPAAK